MGGGGGWIQAQLPKNSSDNGFVSKEIIIFRGVQQFPGMGGPTFSGGGGGV